MTLVWVAPQLTYRPSSAKRPSTVCRLSYKMQAAASLARAAAWLIICRSLWSDTIVLSYYR